MQNMVEKINETGNRVFLNPKPELSYDELAKKSLSSNTYRGFHKVDKTKPGSKSIFEDFFENGKPQIIRNINAIKNEYELNTFLNSLCTELTQRLKTNIYVQQLESFNKVRKPLDIVIEHFISMGVDFTDCRAKLTSLLFLPLDSQMFQSEYVFSDRDLKALKIKRNFTFKDIREEDHYYEIQSFLKEKAIMLGLKARIYFDLLWNDRFLSHGRNLLETNP